MKPNEERAGGIAPPATRAAPWGIGDFFLRAREAKIRALPLADRLDLRRLCDLARQKLTSAELLWASEQTAEGLRLAAAALRLAVQAAELAAQLHASTTAAANDTATANPDAGDAADAADASATRAARAASTLGAASATVTSVARGASAADAAAPEHNRDTELVHHDRFAAMTNAVAALLDLAAPLTMTVAAVKLGRATRVLFLALGALIVIGAFRRCLAVDESFTITASGTYDAVKFGADKAADRNPSSEWLLPSRTPGWLDVKFSRRDLRLLQMRNAVNPTFNDRGTREFRVEAYREGHLVHSSKHSFPPFTPEPAWLEIPVALDDVDGLRIMIDGYHQAGGGLSELIWK